MDIVDFLLGCNLLSRVTQDKKIKCKCTLPICEDNGLADLCLFGSDVPTVRPRLRWLYESSAYSADAPKT